MTALPMAVPQIDRATYERLARRAKVLSWLSLVWMTVEGAVAIAAGLVASAIALEAFESSALIGGERAEETWWWLDPVVGLLIAALAVEEGATRGAARAAA